MTPQSTWLIGGPTASGKSALALRLAAGMGGELVNADSMQLYADLRILTARPSAADERVAPHHLFGLADAAEAWSVGRWLRAVRPLLADIADRGRTAVIVGGTGLYFRALTVGLAEAPASSAAVRAEAAELFDRLGEAGFRQRLAKVDPAAEQRIGPADRQRLTRAMEVFMASGRPLSAWLSITVPLLPAGAWRGLILDPPRETLYRRCDERLGRMVEDGALREVARLAERRLDPALPAMKALGVAPLAAHLRGELPLDAALQAARRDTRRYAKRQVTWFRNQTPDWPRQE